MRYFFEKTKSENSSLFQNLKIYADKEIMKHCGKYPVIFLTLKDVKCHTWKETYDVLKDLIRIEFEKHRYLLNGTCLSEDEKIYYNKILKQTAAKGKETLDHAAGRALEQIEKKRYDVELLQAEVSSILKYGIAFDKKKAAIKGTEEIRENSQM